MPENTGKTEKKILVEGWRSKVSEQKTGNKCTIRKILWCDWCRFWNNIGNSCWKYNFNELVLSDQDWAEY